MKSQVAPRTHERYGEIALRSIAPLLGNVLLPKLRAVQISAAYCKALAEGRRNGKGGLAPRTVAPPPPHLLTHSSIALMQKAFLMLRTERSRSSDPLTSKIVQISVLTSTVTRQPEQPSTPPHPIHDPEFKTGCSRSTSL